MCGAGSYGKFLYFSLNFAVNLNLLLERDYFKKLKACQSQLVKLWYIFNKVIL